MPVPRLLLDTNVLVRFITGDPADMAEKARRLVERADAGELVLHVTPVILAETFFTLESYYTMNRQEVAVILRGFLNCRGIEVTEKERLLDALLRCRDKSAHFADAYLAACAVDSGEAIASFDRDFDKFKDVKRVEPKA
jgi:predicted nucleic acid-binding protein